MNPIRRRIHGLPAWLSTAARAALMLSILAASADHAAAQRDASAPPPVIIDFFYEPGCPECQRVKEEVIPLLESRYDGFYALNWHDVGIASNTIKLIAYQTKLGTRDRNEPVSMVVDYTYPFNGIEDIKKNLPDQIERCIEMHIRPDWKPPAPITVKMDAQGRLQEPVESTGTFTLMAILFAGFTDGINPCAISTLVFFMSLLAVAKVRGSGLILMGASFCLASFLVYTALGFGLLRVLHTVSIFPAIRKGINVVMLAVLCVLALLSFCDAWRYKRTGDARDIALQLPKSLKLRIHAVMREGVGTGSLVLGGLLAGGTVTVIESVCTGQVYVPTLVLMIKSGKDAAKCLQYLLLYNLMFVLPLATVFILTYFGLRTQTLLDWSKRNVVLSKIMLGLLFAAMAVLLVALSL